MQRYVEPLPFLVLGDPQSNGHIDDFEDEVADNKAVDQGGEHAFELRDDTSGLSAIERRAGENTREQCTDDAADTVHAEGIERVVVTERLLQRGRGEEADDPGGDADEDRRRRHDEARCRRDGHQARDRTRGDAQHTRFPLDGPFKSEEHTSELQSHSDLVCRLLLEKKKLSDDGGGAIVNVASIAGMAPSPAIGYYGRSKSAGLAHTRQLAAAVRHSI